MNIWYLSAHDQPRGQSARTYDFARELIGRGHQVTMFANSYCHWTHADRLGPQEKWRFEEIDGIRVVWLRTIHYEGNGLMRGLNMLSNAWRSLQVSRILSDRPDVVIGPSVPLGTGWAASRIARTKKASFVFEVRDVWPIALVDDGSLSRYSPVYYAFRYIEKMLYRRAQRISATMPFVARHVFEGGGDPGKVVWIPNGVALERFAGFEGYSGGGKLPLVVMYVGGFGAAHDVITVVRAAAILQRKGNDKFRFVIVGNGVKRPECEREASLNKLINIEFRNPVPKADVPKIQREADIFVACVLNSAAYRFGLNLNKIFDYFASGRPVIFAGKTPNDPIAETGAGFSIPPEDPEAMVEALEKYLEMHPAERIAMGKRGRAWVERKFDMKNLGERMECLLLQAKNDNGLAREVDNGS
ncbi:MAG: glycosyltransferase family 4 protein [Elusimicrobia bacterium]|nr:glycosyltransferase family 4 protein [Elusimicrobiota bacterium]